MIPQRPRIVSYYTSLKLKNISEQRPESIFAKVYSPERETRCWLWIFIGDVCIHATQSQEEYKKLKSMLEWILDPQEESE